jgi:hypothetical protein
MSGIYWLASYPKSGNTWIRAFLNNYWSDCDTPADINHLEQTPVASARTLFDDFLGLDSSELTQQEIDTLRPAVYRRLANADERFCKIHDAFQRLPNGEPIFPADATRGVIYVVRSPLDVAVSYTHHNNNGFNETIAMMNDDSHGLFMSATFFNQVHQRMYSWSNHVRSWVDQNDFPLHVVRYEDLVYQPTETFGAIVRFIDEQALDETRLAKAIQFSSFDELKKQETLHGFKEKDQNTEQFFRKGKVGSWRTELSTEQVESIVSDHADVMCRFGYLDAEYEIVY